jgi:hypothetical protein
MIYRYLLLIMAFAIPFAACKQDQEASGKIEISTDLLHESMAKVTDIVIHDIFSPPVASRIYSYASIAAYEVSRQKDSSYLSLATAIPTMESIPSPDPNKIYNFDVAALVAFNDAAKKFIFSEDTITTLENDIKARILKLGVSQEVFANSQEYGLSVSAAIKAWAAKDNYNQTRSFPKYAVTDEVGRWKPTPPAYMDGIEPHWNKIRPFTLDSSAQFKPARPTKYDMTQGSQFYNEAIEVKNALQEDEEEHKEIANFWDCNPYKMNVIGHVMHASKKITPGGHWVGITRIASQKNNSTMVESAYAYMMTSIGLMDGFISCWDEKYRSNLIRPETVINEFIDENWVPLLQTPPFPEYTSGHSVVSGASSIILTSIFGEDFAFDDDTEIRYGLPIRSFTSFSSAAEEAAISRFYGGIHYKPAINNGLAQGKNVGNHVLSKVKLRK